MTRDDLLELVCAYDLHDDAEMWAMHEASQAIWALSERTRQLLGVAHLALQERPLAIPDLKAKMLRRVVGAAMAIEPGRGWKRITTVVEGAFAEAEIPKHRWPKPTTIRDAVKDVRGRTTR